MSDSPSSQGRNTFHLHDAAHHGDTLRIYEIAQISAPQSVCADVDGLNEDGRTALHIAARLGHVEAVRALLKMGADVNVRDFNNDTALHIAASMGHTEVVRVLIEEGGADVTARGHKGNTALHYAAENRRLGPVRFLMSIHVNPSLVDAVNDDGLTPIELATELGYDDVVRVLAVEWSDACARALHIAASEGNAAIIRSLMRAEGSDVNARDEQGDTALHVAADQGHIEAIRILIELGAGVFAVNIDNETPLHAALGSACFNAFSSLLHHIAMYGGVDSGRQQDGSIVRSAWAALGNTTDSNGRTYLHWAAANRDVEGLRALIATGIDFDATVNGSSPLHVVAAEHGADDSEFVDLLLEIGVDCNAVCGQSKETALHTAARHGKSSVVQALIDCGCDVSAVDIDGNTALHLAVGSSDHAEVVASVLLSNMVPTDVSRRNNEGLTPLMIAAKEGNIKVVKSLLNFTDKTDVSSTIEMLDALHCAAVQGHREVCNVICDSHSATCELNPNATYGLLSADRRVPTKSWGSGITPLHVAAAFGRTETIHALISRCGEVADAIDGMLVTPLHLAASNGHVETVSVLIREYGSESNAVNQNGITPLHYAALKGHTETVSMLIRKYGADVNAGAGSGMTPLHYAALKGHIETVSVLILEHGADANGGGESGGTPLHYAALNGNTETVSVLIREHGADVHAVDNGMTSLHYAASNGHTETVSVLIKDHGANVNALDEAGRTPLHYASTNGHIETASVLIREHGVYANPVAKAGRAARFQFGRKMRAKEW